jgi:hypothetical protein
MGQIKFVGGLLMFSIFALSLVIFAGDFLSNNNSGVSLDDNLTSVANTGKGNLSSWKTQVINSSDAFYESEITEGETLQSPRQFELGSSNAITNAIGLVSLSFSSVFGNSGEFGWILTTLAGFLVLTLSLYVWKTIKGGNPN